MLNVVVLIGRLCADPEARTTTSGKSVTSFRIAVNKRTKGADGADADFFNVTCWDKTAEFVSTYLHKGKLVAVEGRLQSRKYTTTEGSTREVVEVVANSVQGLEKKDDGPGRPATVPADPTTDADPYDPFLD